VHVELFAEALCPYCAQFTVEKLKPLFSNGISNIMWLDYIPWGNARYDVEKGEPVCQHGPLECQFNKVLSCAMAAYPMQDDWFPFVECLEGAIIEASKSGSKIPDVITTASACAVHAGIVSRKLIDCYNGELGKALQSVARERTESLKPDHEWVPWVVVNGVPIFDDLDNIKTYVCAAYTLRNRPAACLDPPSPSPSVKWFQRTCLRQRWPADRAPAA